MSNRLPHRIYRAIRPKLYDWGVLKLLRRLFTPEQRARFAVKLGLAGFDISTAPGTKMPDWAKARRPISHFDGVNVVADLRADNGLSEANRRLVRAMQSAGIPLAYIEITSKAASRTTIPPLTPTEEAPYTVTLAGINYDDFHPTITQLDPAFFTNKYVIAHWYWEMDRFPGRWHSLFEWVDEVWVGSRHTLDSIALVSPLPVVCVPPSRLRVRANLTRADFGLPQDRTLFLFSFNARSMAARKNPFGVIEGYRRAFAGTEHHTALVIKAQHLFEEDNHALAATLLKALRQAGGILITANLSREAAHDLTALCDCFVSLHRAEGFGLGLAEAMAMGKPVIATAYSGNMDFMTVQNSYPVRYDLRPVTESDHHLQPQFANLYPPGLVWAEPDIDHAAELMCYIVEHPDTARRIGQQAERDMAAEFDPRRIGERIQSRLQLLAGG